MLVSLDSLDYRNCRSDFRTNLVRLSTTTPLAVRWVIKVGELTRYLILAKKGDSYLIDRIYTWNYGVKSEGDSYIVIPGRTPRELRVVDCEGSLYLRIGDTDRFCKMGSVCGDCRMRLRCLVKTRIDIWASEYIT